MIYPKTKKFRTTARVMVEDDKIIDKKSLSDSLNSWKQGYEYLYGQGYSYPDSYETVSLLNVSHCILGQSINVIEDRVEFDLEVRENFPCGKTLLDALDKHKNMIEFVIVSIGQIKNNEVKIEKVLSIDWRIKMNIIYKTGLLYKFGETGTEGNYFSLQENWLKKQWSYGDLYYLKNGDKLKIFDIKKDEMVWEGEILLDLEHDLSEGHGYQTGEDLGWGLFFDKKNYIGLIERNVSKVV